MGCLASDLFPAIQDMYGEKGICPSDSGYEQKLVDELNRAIPLLMKRLDAKGTVWYWKVPVYGGCFSLPIDCLEVRQAWLDGYALEQRDEWYQGKYGNDLQPRQGWCEGSQLIDVGDGYVIPHRWPDHHFDARLAVMAENDGDAGKTIQVTIVNRYNEEVRETLTLKDSQQLAVFETPVRDVTFLRKPVTQGNVKAYIYYPQTNQRVLMAVYPSWVIVPSYRKKKLPLSCMCDEGTFIIKGKIRYRPIQSGNDVIPICDPQAIGFAFRALTAQRRQDQTNLQDYNANLTFALNELDKELGDSKSRAVVSPIAIKSPFGRRAFCKPWN